MRQVFQRARNSSPCVIFFDELDALCPRRSDMAEVCVCYVYSGFNRLSGENVLQFDWNYVGPFS